jgi:hypothetical protein
LRGLAITEAYHVWCADITYIPLGKGCCYLVAIMDWASRSNPPNTLYGLFICAYSKQKSMNTCKSKKEAFSLG